MKKELIAKLKDNKVGWMFLSEDDQVCMKRVNAKGGLENLRYDGGWESFGQVWAKLGDGANEIFRIKPGYQPEPEFVKREVHFNGVDMCVVEIPSAKGEYIFIADAECHKSFAGWENEAGNKIDKHDVRRLTRVGIKAVGTFYKD